MSTQYPGLPTVATQYWRQYTKATAGIGAMVLFTGALGALSVFTLVPDAKWFLVFAIVGIIVHTAALSLRDLRRGEYDPSQTTFSTSAEVVAGFILLGVYESTLLIIGTGLAYWLSATIGVPFIFAAAVAAYYPIADVLLIRREQKTPGYLAMLVVALLMGTMVNIHISISEALPVIGKRRRPQS